MFRPFAVLFIGLTLALAPLAHAGDRANNSGGGSAEQNVVYAYQFLAEFISTCLASTTCDVDAKDRDILNRIVAALPREGNAAELLIFRTPLEENFILDGAIRIAKTSTEVKSPIYINREMIYESIDGKPSPIGIPKAAAMLIHELGHHHGITDHIYLDLLGAKVRFFLQQTVISQNFDPRLFFGPGAFANIPFVPSFTVIYSPTALNSPSSTHVIVSDSETSFDLTDKMYSAIQWSDLQHVGNGHGGLCQNNREPHKTWKITGYELLSPRWDQSYFYKPFGQAIIFWLRMNGILALTCQEQTTGEIWNPPGLVFELNLTFDKVENKLKFRGGDTDYLVPLIYRNPFASKFN